jgi:hypothetical protein
MSQRHDDNQEWLDVYRPEMTLFIRACQDPHQTQSEMLQASIQRHRQTAFGQDHGFNAIRTYAQFTRNVPLQEYSNLGPYLRSMEEGRQNVLSADPVLAFEETSGTNAMVKRIPYTPTLLASFDRALGVWLCGIERDYPSALQGDWYLSTSPPLKKASSDYCGPVPIGIGQDLAYFNDQVAPYLARAVIGIRCDANTDPESFYRRTMEHLLGSSLSFISVWSPTFFLRLDQHLQTYLRRHRGLDQPFVWKEVFPRLSLLSCWTDAQSAVWLPQVQERLGPVPIQSKGLLSTEGVVSFPLCKTIDPVLAVRSHFFEFRDQHGTVHPAADVKKDESYDIVLTNGAGLWRYVTGDRVRITGFYGRTPCLIFIGRSGRQTDLVGEKISEAQVNLALEQARQEIPVRGYAFLYPQTRDQYTLFVNSRLPQPDLQAFAQQVEQQVRHNPYYDQACCLGQLRPLAVQRLPACFAQTLLAHFSGHRQVKEGDVKLSSLYRPGELEDVLKQMSTQQFHSADQAGLTVRTGGAG